MSVKMFAFVCSVLLLVISLTTSQQNSTNIDDNLMIQYEINTDSTTNYNDEIITVRHDLHKKIMNNTQNDKEFYTNDNHEDNDLIQHKLNKHSMQNKDDEQKSMKSNTNSTNVNHKRNFTLQEVYKNVIEKNDSMSLEVFTNSSKDANETIIVPNEMCHNDTCIRFCCSLGERIVDDNCSPDEFEYIFPKVYTNDSSQSEKRVNELFDLTIGYSSQEIYYVFPENFHYDYKIFTNGSIYLSYYEIFVESTSYCLAVVDGNEFEVNFCCKTYDKLKEINGKKFFDLQIIRISAYMVSLLLLGSVFLVYSILPELRNKHGFMLRNYTGALTVAYSISIVDNMTRTGDTYSVCVTIAFLTYFCYMAGSFWLNIMSFDMWCTFRGFCSLQKNVRQQEKRKLTYHMIFAWGCPFMFAIFCVSMDILSAYVYIPPILRPKFHLGNFCWFHDTGPYLLYYYGLQSMCIIFSICFSISTALKIKRDKKDTCHRLKDSESKCHNDNKKWFNLYLQLFIVLFILMGIRWLITALLLFDNVIIWYISLYSGSLLEIMQNLCVFIIFVWKKTIKRMLFNQFGCGLLPKA